jgi:iron-sulfur cluster repair protein YtfE (RIC family)
LALSCTAQVRYHSTTAAPLTEEARAALESALRYFRADEEESLFPRLRQMRNPNVESAIERLEPLEDEHRLAGPLHAEVEELGQERLATPGSTVKHQAC